MSREKESSKDPLIGSVVWVRAAAASRPPNEARALSRMVATCRIYKKACPNGKVVLYLPKREYVDHITSVDPIEGLVLLDDEYLKQRNVYGHVIATFRYGREDDEVMGLKFVKELYLASQQIYPPPVSDDGQPLDPPSYSKTQQKLIEKLGPNAYPFFMKVTNLHTTISSK
ncbi:arrestin homolog [Caerostris darwini]|uniref:Arrestin homolog n=1 Tax=Caerostris darwini TaxID=1538125 RepID=A0AAV4U4Z5_9ARAC|nr:arrestin homolog [Caerostris darwini]